MSRRKVLGGLLLVALLMMMLSATPAFAVSRTIRVTDQNGAPLAGATVYDNDPGRVLNPGVTLGTTNASGELVADDSSLTSLWASKTGYWTSGWVILPAAPAAIEIELLGKATVTGRLVDSGGMPISGMYLDWSPEDWDVLNGRTWSETDHNWFYLGATTGADGLFSLNCAATPSTVFISQDGGTPAYEAGNLSVSTHSVDMPGDLLTPTPGSTVAAGDIEVEPTAFFQGTINWENPGAGSAMAAWHFNDATAAWEQYLWFGDPGMWGGPYGPNWGIPAGTYRFSCGQYTDDTLPDGGLIDVFATADGSRVTDVNLATSYTLTAGQTTTVNWLVTPAAPSPVYRFYNPRLGVHFYTASEAEKNNVIATLGGTYTFEGAAYSLNPAANSQPLHRFFNRRAGVHFYTASETEKANVQATLGHIFTYEGVAYNVSMNPAAGSTAYRFYRPSTGTHFYTASEAEKANVQATLGHIFTYEGPAFYLGQ